MTYDQAEGEGGDEHEAQQEGGVVYGNPAPLRQRQILAPQFPGVREIKLAHRFKPCRFCHVGLFGHLPQVLRFSGHHRWVVSALPLNPVQLTPDRIVAVRSVLRSYHVMIAHGACPATS